MLASGALMFLALAAAFISVAFVGLSKLWKVK
ncbi:hypothetical protein SP99_02014 [Enterobacter sp. BIDMC92]|nr:hypothetical protein SP99_02014 [Enterobacter sp. BIDMC92]